MVTNMLCTLGAQYIGYRSIWELIVDNEYLIVHAHFLYFNIQINNATKVNLTLTTLII